jgi:hypothetical protein
MRDNENANLGAKNTGLVAANLPPEIRARRYDQLANAIVVIRGLTPTLDDFDAGLGCHLLAGDLQDIARLYREGGAS